MDRVSVRRVRVGRSGGRRVSSTRLGTSPRSALRTARGVPRAVRDVAEFLPEPDDGAEEQAEKSEAEHAVPPASVLPLDCCNGQQRRAGCNEHRGNQGERRSCGELVAMPGEPPPEGCTVSVHGKLVLPLPCPRAASTVAGALNLLDEFYLVLTANEVGSSPSIREEMFHPRALRRIGYQAARGFGGIPFCIRGNERGRPSLRRGARFLRRARIGAVA